MDRIPNFAFQLPIPGRRRRAVILPTVLFILLLLALLSSIFVFKVNADRSATQAQSYQLQSRLAAEAGIERVKMLLRESRFEPSVWYDNPDLLHRIIVWTPGGERRLWGTNEELPEGTVAYRFSIVADDPTDDEHFVRFGITDEAARLNLNTATEPQLLSLVQAAVADFEDVNAQEIVDAILDWRDADSKPNGTASDTEGAYYRSLDKPYLIKNGPYDTVEELLLVKGVTREILYGEDMDRNGLLTPNEDDEDLSYPPDNQDNKLNRGLFPYLTVQSFETNISNDQRPRVYLLASEKILRDQLDPDFADHPEVVDQIVQAVQLQRGANVQRKQSESRRQAEEQRRRDRAIRRRPGGTRNTAEQSSPQREGANGEQPGKEGQAENPGSKEEMRRQRRPSNTTKPPRPREGESPNPPPNAENVPRRGDGSGSEASPTAENKDPQVAEPGEGQPAEGQPPLENPDGQEQVPVGEGQDGAKKPKGSNDGQPRLEPIRSAASLFRPGKDENGHAVPSPLSLDLLPVLMDRTSAVPPSQQKIVGLININTAPPQVLRCIEELSEAQVEAIVAKRAGLEKGVAATTAWLVTEGILDLETFDKVAPQVTARGQQFSIEALGYADHMGMVTRLDVVVDLVGPVAQTIYCRDTSYLGGSFPIRESDKEKRKRVR